MTKPTKTRTLGGSTNTLAKIIGAGALLTLPLSSQAFQLKFDDSSASGFLDTTVSLGGIWRTEDPVLSNSGNTNFEESGELVSTPLKVTVEAGYSKNSKGIFVRGSYIYDAKIMGLDTNVFNITSAGQDEIGNKFQLLDAFVYGNFAFDENMLSVRVGNQVLSWGESTFIGNSLNSINPIDATKARGAAVEVKEILLPLPMVWASLDFGGNFSIDAYYVAKWQETIIDPVGTFFATSSTDPITEGGTVINNPALPAPIPRGASIEPDDGGEYGFAFRTLIENWAYMEVAAYYMRYHSHSPFLSITSPISAGAHTYQTQYPEDIDLFGASFNVDLPGELGLSLGAEISHRPDVPMSLGSTIFGLINAGAGTPPTIITHDGFSLGDLTQIQTSITYQGGSNNWFASEKMTILVEPGLVMANMPSGGPLDTAAFAKYDDFSWGYVALIKLQYSNVFFDMNLEPSATLKHDVSGTSPGSPSGTFLEGRKSLTVAVTATYLTSSTIDIGYTRNWGNLSNNTSHDKDFFALTFKHSL
ncbi:MAG: DUF1302 domain-containing protein [Pseudomonadales bacterium]|nr:DUF1302 domain-containing protein [Pseudomonadales bacterium]